VVHDDEPVGPDGLRVCFDDERAVSDAGVMLVAVLANRLGVEALPGRVVRLRRDRPGAANAGRKVMAILFAMVAFASESAQVVGHLARRGAGDQFGDLRAQGAVRQACEQVLEGAQPGEERHHSGVTEVQSGRGLAVLDRRRHQTRQRRGVRRALARLKLGVEQPIVDLITDRPEAA
jgi:hypothetical protein